MTRGLISRTRSAITTAVRSRVDGERYGTASHQVWNTPGARWFTRDDAIWRVHRDTSMFIGGIRALLLQSLHPVAMQAVAEHSGYRGDPWGRLQRTSRFISVTTYGTIPDAESAIAKVRHVHDFIKGVTPTGVPYEAGDPHLLRWVHCAEIDSFLSAHQAFGARRLSAAASDDYVAQTAVVAERLGVVDPPRTTAELAATLLHFRIELDRTDAALEAADLLLRRPPLPATSRPAYQVLVKGALSIMPPWALARLHLPYVPLADVVAKPLARAATRTLQWVLAGDPENSPPPARPSASPRAGRV